jgi:hypothetical protein
MRRLLSGLPVTFYSVASIAASGAASAQHPSHFGTWDIRFSSPTTLTHELCRQLPSLRRADQAGQEGNVVVL